MYAIIKTSGKQYKVEPDGTLEIDRIPGEAGDAVEFKNVLMVSKEGETVIGSPVIEGAVVTAEIKEQFRGPKLIVFKMKRRKRSRVKNGHRQEMTRLIIKSIALG